MYLGIEIGRSLQVHEHHKPNQVHGHYEIQAKLRLKMLTKQINKGD